MSQTNISASKFTFNCLVIAAAMLKRLWRELPHAWKKPSSNSPGRDGNSYSWTPITRELRTTGAHDCLCSRLLPTAPITAAPGRCWGLYDSRLSPSLHFSSLPCLSPHSGIPRERRSYAHLTTSQWAETEICECVRVCVQVCQIQ